jgi:ATP-dependent RNA helicase DeaD
MSPDILAITKNYMTDPVEITIGQKNSGAENVSHIYHMVHSKDRYEALKRVVDNYPDMYAIVFCRTRQEAKDVAASLMRDGYNADALHGDLSQSQRDFVMQKFREKTLSVLVGTDVAARGLDVNNLTHVINYNLPDDLEVYTHRSGRTGRAGKEGIAISIINMKERGHIAQIEKSIHKKIAFMPVPTGKEICERRLFDMIEHMQQITVDHGQIDLYIDKAYDMLKDISKEEIIKRFVYVEFSRFLDYYKNSPDLNNDQREQHGAEGKSSGRGKNRGRSMARIVLNVGKGKNITKREIINLVASTPSSKNVEIGLIEIYKKASSVEVESKMAKAIVSELNAKTYKGLDLKAEENYEFTGISHDDREWEPHHKRAGRSSDKNGRQSFNRENRNEKTGYRGKGQSHYPKTKEKRDRGQGGRN